MRITSITPMRNEAPYLLEWVAYHRLIGINDIVVFSNHCTDGTNLMLERLDELGLIRHYTNPSVYTGHSKHHLEVIRYVNSWDRLRRSDWVVNLDSDEFICIKVGLGQLEDLFNSIDRANMICMSQHNFGSGGRKFFKHDLSTRQFEMAWSYDGAYHRNANQRGVKTLTHRSSNPKKWLNHSPIFSTVDANLVRPINGSGHAIEGYDLTQTIKSLPAPDYGFDLVQLNHYAIRSAEDFLLKLNRGNANHVNLGYSMKYWRKYDQGNTKDNQISRWVHDIEAQKNEYLKDPELASLEAASVKIARDRIAETRKTKFGAELMSKIDSFRKKMMNLREI